MFETALLAIKADQTKKINGISVVYNGHHWIIDSVGYDLEDADRQLQMSSSQKTSYDHIAFVVIKNNQQQKVVRVRSKAQHRELVEQTVKDGAALYYGDVVERDGKFFIKRPLLFDWDCLETQSQPQQDLICPNCGKEMHSSSGLTLHLKVCTAPVLDQELACPYCPVVATSKSGLTLHRKAKHDGR